MPNRGKLSLKVLLLMQLCSLHLWFQIIFISATSTSAVEVLYNISTDGFGDNQPIVHPALDQDWIVSSNEMQMIKPTSSQQPNRQKRQAFRTWGGKRTEYENEELDEQLENDSQNNNRKKSKTFVAWGGKRNQMSPPIALQAAAPAVISSGQTEEDLTPALKRFRAWGGKKRSEKPFRTWGGKRSPNVDSERLVALNEMLNRLQRLSSLPIYQENIASRLIPN